MDGYEMQNQAGIRKHCAADGPTGPDREIPERGPPRPGKPLNACPRLGLIRGKKKVGFSSRFVTWQEHKTD